MVILMLSFLFSGKKEPRVQPTPTVKISPVPKEKEEVYQDEIEGPLDSLPGFLKKEAIEKEKVYYYSSKNPDRPDIIVEKQGKIVFERKVPPLLTTVEDYTVPFGQPEDVLIGSTFYGQGVFVYVYGKDGIGFIADEKNIVLEQHLFPPDQKNYYLKSWAQK